nr:RNA-directed DNA polymerase [Lysinibacillus sphaericus]
MALLHPLAQLQMFRYIIKYDQLIASFCKQSKFSVRSPIIRNQPVFNFSNAIKKELSKIHEEFSFKETNTFTSDETTVYFYNYFSYRNFKKITDLYKSTKFKRDLYKYEYFKKLDIQNFFSSIYTHSLAWAIMGDKSIAKKYKTRTYDEIFPNATDKVCQIINFNETNGIVTGPEFSRIISEVLLTRIDINLYRILEKEGLSKDMDYKIYRFMDDYYIFFNEQRTINIIEDNLIQNFDLYNLKLNTNKTTTQSRPFQFNNAAITKLIYLIDTYKFKDNDNYYSYKSKLQKIHQNIELIITDYPTSTSQILNYFLKYIRSVINFEIDKFTLTMILEMISNIYSLNINYHSTHNLIATYAVLTQKCNKIKSDYNKNMNIESEMLNKITYLEERFFQHLFIILRNNFNQIPQMYDIFIFLKILPKKVSSDFLCKVLDKYPDNYFVMCSIAYYILNDNLNAINPIYKTVEKRLISTITQYINSYKTLGSDYKFLESNFFYVLNDFSHYPGFTQEFKNYLRKTLFSDSPYRAPHPNMSERESTLNSIIEYITESSYYNWKKTTEDFIKEIAKKSSNLLNKRIRYD